MNLWTYSLRQMARRPGRSLLTLASIALGVAAVFAVSTTIVRARAAYGRLDEAVSGKADAEVVARGGGRFAQELAAPLENSPAVQVAVPLLRQYTLLSKGTARIQILGIGTVLAEEKKLRPFDLVSGRLPDRDGEILLEEGLARSAGIETGDDVRLLTRRGVRHVRVVGVIRPLQAWAFAQGGLAYLRLGDWQGMCKAPGQVDALHLLLKPSADRAAALRSLGPLLPAGLQLRSAGEAHPLASATLPAFEFGLEASRLLAVVVAALLILNTFQMNVSERRGQLAVLRLIGATRRQVTALLLREGVVLGLAGAALGLPAGWALAHWLGRGVETGFSVSLDGTPLTPGWLLAAFALGPALGLLATWVPARQAGLVRPLQSLRQGGLAAEGGAGWRKTAAGCLLVLLSGPGVYLTWVGVVPQRLVLWLGVGMLLGLVLLFPLVLRPAYALVYRLLRFLGPTEFQLAYGQTVRAPGRAQLTWGVLFVAVVTSVTTGLILTDVLHDVHAAYRTIDLADFVVRVARPDLRTGAAAKLPDDLAGQVRGLDGVQSVETTALVGMEHPDLGRVVAVVREFTLHEELPLALDEGDPPDVHRKLLEGEVVLSDILAHRLKKHAGDEVTLAYEGKQYAFRVAGTAPMFLVGGIVLFLDRQAAEQRFGPLGGDALLVNAGAGQRQGLEERLRALCVREGILFQTYAEAQQRLQMILSAVAASLWALLTLGFLIAVFGVTNTLLMNVLEQTHEIGLARVLGMQRRQVRRMVLAQSAYVGLLAIVPGLGAGVFLAYVVRATALAILGDRPHFGALLPWLLPYAAGLLLLVLVFGWLPAARAARLRILDAIRTE